MVPLGAYHMPDRSPLAASDDPRMRRLRAAWPSWQFRAHPQGGTLCHVKGGPGMVSDYAAARDCGDGMRWLPPQTMPTLYDLAREVQPQPATRVLLRRIGEISIPLGTGPVYGAGPRRGRPSSEFGALASDLYRRSVDTDLPWTDADELDVERLLFLAIRFGYCLTWELFGELAPYDLDEVSEILSAIWGSHPKPLGSDGSTSQQSPPEPSPTPSSPRSNGPP
jgi:hypothetical protein